MKPFTAIIEKERPDALLPTVGGQTGLNLSVELYEQGILDKFGVKLIGANIDAIKVGEDRELFKKAMDEIGIPSAKGGFAHTWEEAKRSSKKSVIRRSSARLSRSAAQAAARLITPKNLKKLREAGLPRRRIRRF